MSDQGMHELLQKARIKSDRLELDVKGLTDTNELLNRQLITAKQELGKSHIDVLQNATVIAHVKTIKVTSRKLGNWRVIAFMLLCLLAAESIYIWMGLCNGLANI